MPSEDSPQQAWAAIHESGASQWPQVRVALAEFAAYASSVHLSQSAVAHAGEVFLACACLAGEPRALMELERLIAAHVPVFVSRIDSGAAFMDEVRQRVRQLLLNGDPPKLARYSGMGSFLSWLRVVTIRAALDIKRAARDEPETLDDDVVEQMVRQPNDPEIDLMKRRYHGIFEQAMVAGVARLTTRQRAVLRLYLVAQLNIDEIGTIYGVHRSTIARWASLAQRAVLDGVRAHLRERYDIHSNDLRSLVRLVRSDLHGSLGRLLRL